MNDSDRLLFLFLFLIAVTVALAACTTGPKPDVVVRDRVTTVNKPVLQKCVGQRPAQPKTIAQAIPDDEWNAMSGTQALLEAGKIGLEWFRYGQRLETETSECE